MYTVVDEIHGWRKIDDIFRYMQRINPSFHMRGEFFLYFGAITNIWVIFWCVVDSYFLIGGSLSPKDCILDSLGLVFLFSLDDVGAAVSFVSEDVWPGDRLGWIYDKVVKEQYEPTMAMIKEESTRSTGLKVWRRMKWCCTSCVVLLIKALQYLLAIFCGLAVVVVPYMVANTPFLELVPQEGEGPCRAPRQGHDWSICSWDPTGEFCSQAEKIKLG
jgi:hypothetical protein